MDMYIYHSMYVRMRFAVSPSVCLLSVQTNVSYCSISFDLESIRILPSVYLFPFYVRYDANFATYLIHHTDYGPSDLDLLPPLSHLGICTDGCCPRVKTCAINQLNNDHLSNHRIKMQGSSPMKPTSTHICHNCDITDAGILPSR